MIEQLIEAGREIVEAGMVKGWGGNLSGRFRGSILMTRSGADLGHLAQHDFVVIEPDKSLAQLKEIRPKPSSELSMHLAAYEAQSETQAIIHVHPPKAISLGLIGHSLPALTPDFYLHLGKSVPLLEYVTPTTEKLGTAVAHILQQTPAVLLQNHGVLVIGHSVSQALLRLTLLEEQAGIYLDALAVATPRIFTSEDMEELDRITDGRYKMDKN